MREAVRAPAARGFVGGTVWILLAESLAIPAGVLTAAFLGRRLGPTGYGLFALAASLVALVEWLIAAMFSRATIKLVGDSPDWRPVGVTSVRVQVLAAIAAAFVVWGGARPLSRLLDEPSLEPLLALFAVELPIFGLLAGWRNVQVGTGRFGARAVAGAVRWCARLALIVVFVEAGLSVAGAVLGSIGATMAAWAISRAMLRIPLTAHIRYPARRLLAIAAPLFALAIALRLLDRLGLFVLKALGAGTADVGLYAAAQNLALPPVAFAQTLSPVLLAVIGTAVRDGTPDRARATATDALRVVFIGLPFAAIGTGAAGEILGFVYGGEFLAAAPLAPALLTAGMATAVATVTTTVLVAADRPWQAVVPTIVGLPVAVAGSVLLFAPLGSGGVAAAMALAAMIVAMATMSAARAGDTLSVPWTTLVRCAAVGGLALAASVAWESGGLQLMVKLATLGCGVVAALAVTGEFTPAEIALVGALLRREPRATAAATAGLRQRWDRVAARFTEGGHYLDDFLGDLKRQAYLDLTRRWAPPAPARVLKTDLFEEAVGPDGFLDRLGDDATVKVGCDISERTAARAVHRPAAGRVVAATGDVRQLPFRNDAFDLIVSPSTLDHFESTAELDLALGELRRVLAPGGTLIVTLDNPANVTDPLLRLAAAAGLVPYPLGQTYSASALTAALRKIGLEVADTAAIVHHPRLLATGLVAVARAVRWPAVGAASRRLILWFRRFEGSRWQYLTGCFVAARAVKRGTAQEGSGIRDQGSGMTG